MTTDITANFPAKLQILFTPTRYKVARGGRAGGKSWSFARALLLVGMQPSLLKMRPPLRILCTREIQRSIKDSVHRLLSDQIDMLGLGAYYNVFETTIIGSNGTQFLFAGLSSQTITSLKSMESIDICWVEEAHVVSRRSWDILEPTIRKEGSEIWISYNPELDSDEVHQRFTIHQPDNCANVVVNWRNNPWFSETANAERMRYRERDPDNYAHVWEGQCLPAVSGAIYSKQMAELERQKRICNVPYDPLLKVHIVCDLGYTDAMAIGLIQHHAGEIRIIDYIEDTQKTLADYSQMLKARDYNYGRVYLPHDGFARGVKSGKSSAEILERLGWDVVPRNEIVHTSVEEGIKAVRLAFSRFYFNKEKCAQLIEHLRQYRRNINASTGAAGSPVHDDHSHAADMVRYVALNVDSMINADQDVDIDFTFTPSTDWSW